MELDIAIKLIRKYMAGHADFITRAGIARRYYNVQNDILFLPSKKKQKEDTGEAVPDPLRTADNRIPISFYELLVNQKAAYMFTAPPLFDVKDDNANAYITETLGDAYQKKCMNLCIDACNTGIGWVHYWEDEQHTFHWGVVPSEEIIPVWSADLDHGLVACLRAYENIDDDGTMWDLYEVWDDTACQTFKKRKDDTIEELAPWARFSTGAYLLDIPDNGENNIYRHPFGRVPFIPFRNNSGATSDLTRVKKLIDAYDRVFSGFLNDLEDIQEVIFVLTGYGGEDLKQFIHDLKYYKAISLDDGGVGSGSGVSTLTINIPVEARDKMLEITRKAIFTMGQGIDPEQQGLDKTSGEAMKFLYATLELKAGLLQTEFTLGFNELIRAMLAYKGMQVKGSINQTWTRTAIRNDAELVDMCSKSEGVISRKTILKNHPFVENAEDEEKQIAQEQQEEAAQSDPYKDLGTDVQD